ncbi:hypothetical protein EPN81_02490 [Patescibacteria group bacterium]|nr:MAG: hypothetical protein EPN81_02490 [Patescibacteria group bacterium]
MQILRRYFGVNLLTVFAVGLFTVTLPIQAAEKKCECYCNIEGTGATAVPDEETDVTSSECKKLCADRNSSVAVCALNPSEKPEYNVMCFTPDECTAQKGTITASGTGTPTQPGDCKAGMFYCYPDPKTRMETTLQVPIAGLTVTGDFGEYIATAYKWLIGTSTTIAIVLLMVAGLRWTLGGLSPEQIGKAKKTIANAVIGLVLLMLTYVILLTVNPQLLRLQVPAFPLIKPVSVVGQDSCGYLTGKWGTQAYLIANGAPLDSPHVMGIGNPYTLEGAKDTNCGTVANVTKDPEGKHVADDMTCTYDYCPKDGNEKMHCFGVGATAECLTCLKVKAPTSENCSVLTTKQFAPGNPGKILNEIRCFFSRGISSNVSTLTTGTCARLVYECKNIKKCSDYDDIIVRFGNTDLKLDEIDNNNLSQQSDTDLGSLCAEDPCRVAPPEESCQAKYGDFSVIFGLGKAFNCKSSSEWAK